jgi:hypothetical protein
MQFFRGSLLFIGSEPWKKYKIKDILCFMHPIVRSVQTGNAWCASVSSTGADNLLQYTGDQPGAFTLRLITINLDEIRLSLSGVSLLIMHRQKKNCSIKCRDSRKLSCSVNRTQLRCLSAVNRHGKTVQNWIPQLTGLGRPLCLVQKKIPNLPGHPSKTEPDPRMYVKVTPV